MTDDRCRTPACPFCGTASIESIVPLAYLGLAGGTIQFTCVPCNYVLHIHSATSDEWKIVMKDFKEHGGYLYKAMERNMYDTAVQECENKMKSFKNSPEYEILAKKINEYRESKSNG